MALNLKMLSRSTASEASSPRVYLQEPMAGNQRRG